MNIEEVVLPQIFEYYIAAKDSEYVRQVLIGKQVNIGFDNKIHIVLSYDDIVYNVLRSVINKTEQVTIGNQLKYEYELDLGSGNTNHIFMLTIDGEVAKYIMTAVWYCTDNNLVKIIFKKCI